MHKSRCTPDVFCHTFSSVGRTRTTEGQLRTLALMHLFTVLDVNKQKIINAKKKINHQSSHKFFAQMCLKISD